MRRRDALFVFAARAASWDRQVAGPAPGDPLGPDAFEHQHSSASHSRSSQLRARRQVLAFRTPPRAPVLREPCVRGGLLDGRPRRQIPRSLRSRPNRRREKGRPRPAKAARRRRSRPGAPFRELPGAAAAAARARGPGPALAGLHVVCPEGDPTAFPPLASSRQGRRLPAPAPRSRGSRHWWSRADGGRRAAHSRTPSGGTCAHDGALDGDIRCGSAAAQRGMAIAARAPRTPRRGPSATHRLVSACAERGSRSPSCWLRAIRSSPRRDTSPVPESVQAPTRSPSGESSLDELTHGPPAEAAPELRRHGPSQPRSHHRVHGCKQGIISRSIDMRLRGIEVCAKPRVDLGNHRQPARASAGYRLEQRGALPQGVVGAVSTTPRESRVGPVDPPEGETAVPGVSPSPGRSFSCRAHLQSG